MSFIIKGAKVPTTCQECPCFANMRVDICETDEKLLFQRCGVTKQVLNIATDIDEIGDDWYTTHIPESCPIIEIPEHHGNLVDVDALANDLDADVKDIYNINSDIKVKGGTAHHGVNSIYKYLMDNDIPR